MARRERLRLFPLFTVLFPGMRIPLQVFEERYRTLVAECLSASEPFGVVLIKEGREVGGAAVPHAVGTTARIEAVQPLATERLRVQVRGERRFRIIELYYDRPYLSAEVEYPVDEASEVPPPMLDEVRVGFERLERLKQTMESRYSRAVRVPDSAGELADAVGATAARVLPAPRLQPLLEALDVRRRLELAQGVLGELIEATHGQAREVVARRWASRERRN